MTAWICAVLVVFSFAVSARSAFAEMIFADPASFYSGSPPTYPYSQSMNWKGTNDLTVTANSGTNMARHHNWADSTFPQPPNPTWLPDSPMRRFWPEKYVSGAATTQYTINFANPLVAGDVLMFVDFDYNELVAITAYDPSNNLIDLSGWTFQNLAGHNTVPLSQVTWNVTGLGTGQIEHPIGAPLLGNEPLHVLFPNGPVGRLVYDFNFRAVGDVEFNFGWYQPDFVETVPEPTSLATFGMGAVLCLALVGRRRSLRADKTQA